jgi:hypothetical protein
VVVVIVLPFPTPPIEIEQAFTDLAVARFGDEEAIEALGDIGTLPRPWDPSTCPAEMRQALWAWLDDVAAWLNHEYSWRPATMIPPCWPLHPHLVHELAVLASLRAEAAHARSPDPLEDWHRYALPGFIERMNARLGGGCQNDSHTDWPAAGRHNRFSDELATEARMAAFYDDTHAEPASQIKGTDAGPSTHTHANSPRTSDVPQLRLLPGPEPRP